MVTKSIAERVKYFRQSKGYSQGELSLRTNVTVRTIQRIESAEVNPHLNTIKQLAIALDVEVNDLLPQENPNEETIKKKWLLLIHGTPLLGIFIPLGNVLFPLFLWIHKREDNSIYYEHGVKVVNFQITSLIFGIAAFISLVTIEKWGFFFFISFLPIYVLIILANIIYVLNSEKCYYPFSVPFLSGLKIKSKASNAIFIFLGLMTFASCKTNVGQQIERLDGSIISKDSLTNNINQLMDDADVHGMAVAVFSDNEPVYEKTFGFKDYPQKLPLTDTTNIYGASFSKAFFSVLAMKLVEEGFIDLDTPLESYLPKKLYEYAPQTRWHDDFSDLRVDSQYHHITGRMCLNHTTGFANYRWFEKDQKLRVNFNPGTKYSYSGEGFIYLQVVLEKLTGKGLEQLAQELIFEPLAMNNSAYEWKVRFENDFAFGHNIDGDKYKKDKDNEPRGGGTLETTSEDYIKFLTAVLNKKIISDKSYNEIFKSHIRIKSLAQFGPNADVLTDKYDSINLGYGLGWGYIDTPYGRGVFKEGNGNGFVHHSVLFPDAKKGIMIMTNSDNGHRIFKELLDVAIKDVYTPWEWEGYLPYNSN